MCTMRWCLTLSLLRLLSKRHGARETMKASGIEELLERKSLTIQQNWNQVSKRSLASCRSIVSLQRHEWTFFEGSFLRSTAKRQKNGDERAFILSMKTLMNNMVNTCPLKRHPVSLRRFPANCMYRLCGFLHVHVTAGNIFLLFDATPLYGRTVVPTD